MENDLSNEYIIDIINKYKKFEDIKIDNIEDRFLEIFKTIPNYKNILLTELKKYYTKPIINDEKIILLEPQKKEIILSEDQQKFIDYVLEGKNIFLTGSGGNGKSLVLKMAVEKIKEINNYDNTNIGITSTTGISAILINGNTIHSYLKIGLALQSAEELYIRLKNNKNRCKFDELKNNLKILVIDEISMCGRNFLNKISKYLQLIKNNELPFGGIQIIFIGDLFQLSPIKDKGYVFESGEWIRSNLEVIILNKSFRQDGDTEFQEILNNIRIGFITNDMIERLSKCNNENNKFSLEPAKIFPTNKEVDLYNDERFKKLCTDNNNEVVEYPVIEKVKNKVVLESIYKSRNIKKDLALTLNAQIMITFNIDTNNGIINGLMGKVIKLNSDSIVIEDINKRILTISYIHCLDESTINTMYPKILFSYLPVRLAFAISIHKTQGQTLSFIEIDFKHVFGYHMSYVAISRVRSLDRLVIKNLTRDSFKVDPKVVKFYNNI
jgi:ATP-dependent DNA helicase PIF1